MVDETMANAARVHAVEKGAVASEHTLIAFGGAAPIHAARLAEKLLINRIVVPSYAGVGSAIGFLRAPVSYDVVRSRHMRLDRLDHESANQILADMKVEATAVVAAGAPGKEMTEARGAYMRYVGQGHEIYVSLPLRDLEPTDREALQDAFDAEYEKLYKRAIPNAEVEVLTWALALSADLNVVDSASPPDQPGYPEGLSTDVSGATGSRPVFDPERGENVDIALYWRSDLSSGARITGPAFIAENETSTFVAAGFDATITRNGHIVAERNGDKQPGASIPVYKLFKCRSCGTASLRSSRSKPKRLCARHSVPSCANVATCPRVSSIAPGGCSRKRSPERRGTLIRWPSQSSTSLTTSLSIACTKATSSLPMTPWMGTGHLNDFVLTKPCFHHDKLVALFSCTSHLTDIGGIGTGPDGTGRAHGRHLHPHVEAR